LEEGENAVAEIPKDGFKNGDQLYAWLKTLPENKRECITAIAVR
jgi:hypothetical protein